MACNLVEGYSLACRDAVSGIKEFWITEFANVSSYTETSGTVTALTQTASTRFWKYSVEKENAILDEDDVNSVENGTRFWQVTFTCTLKKLTAKNRNNIKLVGQNRLVLIVHTNNDDYKIIGLSNGLDLTTGKGSTGKGFGDLNGYTITLTGKEPAPMFDLSSSIITSMTQGQ